MPKTCMPEIGGNKVVKFLLANVVFALSTTLAAAADLRAPMMAHPQPLFSWTGFYGGIAGGLSLDQSSLSYPGSAVVRSHSATSGLVVGQIGYNYQINSVVLGVQGDGGWAGLSGSGPCGNPAFVCTTKQDWLASVTGRAGYAFGQSLFYVKGGAAFTETTNHGDLAATPLASERAKGSRTGWTLGGGVEYAFLQHWSSFLEYDHYDFGTANLSSYRVATGAFVNPLNIRQTTEVVKLGVNYHY